MPSLKNLAWNFAPWLVKVKAERVALQYAPGFYVASREVAQAMRGRKGVLDVTVDPYMPSWDFKIVWRWQ